MSKVLENTARRYGKHRPSVVLVHGGPGAAGELAPLAKLLAARGFGVLEPFQTGTSIDAQIAELRDFLQALNRPVALVGWSWGAWLALMVAVRNPELLSRLVLIGCPPFLAEDAHSIHATRMARLSPAAQEQWDQLMPRLEQPDVMDQAMALFDTTDCFARDNSPRPLVWFDPDIHQQVWAEAAALRRSKALILELQRLRLPILALHGDYDPHPADAVQRSLRLHQPKAAFHLLQNCGHKPWQELHAKSSFLTLLCAGLPRQT